MRTFIDETEVPKNRESQKAAAPAAIGGGKTPGHPLSGGAKAATPAEGAELIRAFLRIERAEVRAAFVELAVRLAESTRPFARE